MCAGVSPAAGTYTATRFFGAAGGNVSFSVSATGGESADSAESSSYCATLRTV